MLRLLWLLFWIGSAVGASASMQNLGVRPANKRIHVPTPRWNPQNYNIAAPGTFCAWWTARDYGTGRMTDAGGGAISSWIDRINNITLTAIGAARPLYQPPGMLQFDGANDTLATTSYAALPTATAASEIWAVVRQDVGSEAGRRALYSQGTSATTQLRALYKSTSVTFQVNSGVTALNGPSNTFGDAHIVQGGFAAGQLYGSQDGTPFGPLALAYNTVELPMLRIGAGSAATAANFWQGMIIDVVVTCRALTTLETQQLHGYLAHNSALVNPAPLPDSNPFKVQAP